MLDRITSHRTLEEVCLTADGRGGVPPVSKVAEVVCSAAGPDVAVLVHVHFVIGRDEHIRPNVKFAAVYEQGLLNVLLHHPLRPNPAMSSPAWTACKSYCVSTQARTVGSQPHLYKKC